jgi:predicted metalloprotease with PDZ domain
MRVLQEKELLNTLSRGNTLIAEMFEKLKTPSYRYEYALELLEDNEDIIKLLLNKNIIVQNGAFLELDDQFLNFFKDILEVNEEINTSYINENIQQVFEIKHKTNIHEVLSQNNTLIFETKPSYRLKLSIDNLQRDENYSLIIKIRNRYKSAINPIKQIAENLTSQDLELGAEKEIFIDLYKVRNDFKRSGNDLFGFLMNYQFVREVPFEESYRKVV